MQVIDHRLHLDAQTPIPLEEIPNFQADRKTQAIEYLVMHYTAGTSAQAAVNWFKNPNAKVSAHLIIGRDGSVVQLVPFDTVAWHCGDSSWADRNHINHFSIGIEFDNFGFMARKNDQWVRGSHVYPDEEVLKATHKFEFSPRGWHIFPDVQIKKGLEVAAALFEHYKLLDVVGHDDISLNHKVDPGPAFPMEAFRAQLVQIEGGKPVLYRPVRPTWLRSGAGDHHPIMPGSRIENDTDLSILDSLRGWSLAAVQSAGNLLDTQGWIPTRQLKRSLESQAG